MFGSMRLLFDFVVCGCGFDSVDFVGFGSKLLS